MGFRFRKSVKAGPFRMTVSKSGIGYSVGGKGFRVTKKAKGGIRTTASLPGTGISYSQDYGGRRKRSSPRSSSQRTKTKPQAQAQAQPRQQYTYIPASERSYCASCGAPNNSSACFCAYCGASTGVTNFSCTGDFAYKRKNKWLAFALCIFLGYFGVHRFYVGKIGTGVLWLLTFGVFGAGWLMDCLLILLGRFEDKYGIQLK